MKPLVIGDKRINFAEVVQFIPSYYFPISNLENLMDKMGELYNIKSRRPQQQKPALMISIPIPRSGPIVSNRMSSPILTSPQMRKRTLTRTRIESLTQPLNYIYIYNCNTDNRDINIWIFDYSLGTWQVLGSLEAQYDTDGNCPAFGSVPFTVTLQGWTCI